MNDSTSKGAALVTGCSSGFGLHSAVALAKRGFRVFASMRDPGRRGALDEATKRAGVSVDVVKLDVTDMEAIPRVVGDLEAQSGGVSLLVNNAGVGILGALEDTSMDELRETFECNFFGPAALCKAVIPGMRERRRGRIINISSIGGRLGAAAMASYSASKFALEGMAESLRRELYPFGIDVVIVEPGGYKTTMIDVRRKAVNAVRPESHYRKAVDFWEQSMSQVAKTGPDPSEVGELVAEIATMRSPALRYAAGKEARAMLTMLGVLPGRTFDWLATRMFDKMMPNRDRA